MSMAPLVYALTLSWNGQNDTLACFESLQKLDYPNKRLLLVDNGSTDGTPEAVANQFPTVELIRNETNLGFAAGMNVGLRHALSQKADYIIMVNNDTIIDPAALQKMIPLFGDDVGMVAPKIYYAAEPDRIWSVGGLKNPLTLEMAGDARGDIDREQWAEVLERDYFNGCALLLSSPFLEEVGLFDERFFMYYEDSDLSIRARQAGYRLLLSPHSHVWHKVATTSGGSDSPNERYWMARSSIIFFRKHVHGWRWLIVVPYRTASAFRTISRLLWRRRFASVKAYIRGLRDGLGNSFPTR